MGVLLIVVTSMFLLPSALQAQNKDPTEDAPEEMSGKFFARRYLTESKALDLQKKDPSDRVEETVLAVSDTLDRRIRQNHRVSLYWDTYVVHKLYEPDAEEPYRYAIHMKQPGQHKFMDLMYGINPDGTVHRIDLMVYREPIGSDVKSRRFMRQFEGRSLATSEFRVNLDVIHIAGATISSKSVARGTRKVLAILKYKDLTTNQ
jgi:Na+-translocating ferredoxin:NAD+ oxidoreductase RnfG subunit